MDATLLAPLLTPSGWALLETLPPYDERQALTLGERLRAEGHSPELVAAALTQQRLRGRAAAKFGPFASQMLFTPDGLEQARREGRFTARCSRYVGDAAAIVAAMIESLPPRV